MSPIEIFDIIEGQRRRHRLSVAELCSRAGVSSASYKAWYDGKHSPSLNNLEAVANVLDLTIIITRLERTQR